MSVRYVIDCPTCEGTGMTSDGSYYAPEEPHECHDCGGIGEIPADDPGPDTIAEFNGSV